jgi:hypothetical protein
VIIATGAPITGVYAEFHSRHNRLQMESNPFD